MGFLIIEFFLAAHTIGMVLTYSTHYWMDAVEHMHPSTHKLIYTYIFIVLYYSHALCHRLTWYSSYLMIHDQVWRTPPQSGGCLVSLRVYCPHSARLHIMVYQDCRLGIEDTRSSWLPSNKKHQNYAAFCSHTQRINDLRSQEYCQYKSFFL